MIEFDFLVSIIIYLTVFIFSSFTMYVLSTLIKENLFSNNKLLTGENFIIICSLALPLFLSAFRYGVGTDYFAYVNLYEIYKNSSITQVLFEEEPFFKILYIIIGNIFNDSQVFFLIVALITLFFVGKSIYSYKKILYLWLALLIFYLKYYGISLNLMRQLVAVAIILYSYKYLIEQKRLKYIFIVILASFVHITALVTLPLVILTVRNKALKQINFIFVCFIIIFTPIYSYLGLSFLTELSFLKFFETYNIDLSGGGVGFLIWILPVLLPILIWSKKILKAESNIFILIYIYVLQIPFAYLGYMSIYASRLTYYFSIVEIILVSILVRSESNTFWKYVMIIYFICWYTFIFIFNFYLQGGSEIFPLRLQW